MLHVYAVLGKRPARRLGAGICGAPVRSVNLGPPSGAFAVVVSDVAEAPQPDESRLREHDRVVRRAAELEPAALPVRFGCVVEDERELVRLLRERAREFESALERVRDREQMTLRIFQRTRTGKTRKPAPAAGRGAGARYLYARLEANRRAHAALGPLLASLNGLVTGEHIELGDSRAASGSARLLASVYHLVPRGHAAAYKAAVSRGLRRSKGLKAWLSGPCPAYAFAAESLP